MTAKHEIKHQALFGMEPFAAAQAACHEANPTHMSLLLSINTSPIPIEIASGGPAFNMSMEVYFNLKPSKCSGFNARYIIQLMV